jgi:hypothetical protein
MTAKGGETDITLTRWAKTDTRGADDVGTIKKGLEEAP